MHQINHSGRFVYVTSLWCKCLSVVVWLLGDAQAPDLSSGCVCHHLALFSSAQPCYPHCTTWHWPDPTPFSLPTFTHAVPWFQIPFPALAHPISTHSSCSIKLFLWEAVQHSCSLCTDHWLTPHGLCPAQRHLTWGMHRLRGSSLTLLRFVRMFWPLCISFTNVWRSWMSSHS